MTTNAASPQPATPPRAAVIDLGSNAVRLAIFERTDAGPPQVVASRRLQVRLSDGMDVAGVRQSELQPEPIRRTLAALAEFAAICDDWQLRPIAVATSAVRDARNQAEFLAQVATATGLQLRVLTTAEEAYYAYLAVVNTLDVADGYVAEIGGGSVQVTEVRGGSFGASASAPLGAVRTLARYPLTDPPRPAELSAMRAGLADELDARGWLWGACAGTLVGVSGAIKSLGRIHQHTLGRRDEPLHGYRVPRTAVPAALERLAALTIAQRREVAGMDPDRADVILAALMLLDLLLARGTFDDLTVSVYGIREGLALAEFGERM